MYWYMLIFLIEVCDEPEFYTAQSHVRQNSTTAVLQFTFRACYDPNDELVKSHWLKDDRNYSDVRYIGTHNQVNDSLYVFTLTIHNVTVNDSGSYTYQLWYNKTMINSSTVKEGTMYFNKSKS